MRRTSTMTQATRIPALVAIGLSVLAARGIAQEVAPSRPEPDPAALEFFEKEVRPLLAARCQKCHGAKVQKGELRLDSRSSILAGGRTGPALVPGKPEDSLLVDAINYGELYQMPPKSKLPGAEVATLTKWVAMGAPWPSDEGPSPAAKVQAFDLKARAGHWSLRPVQDPEPPAVKDSAWPRTPIDRFLLATLEARGIAPAPDADKRTLIRRLTFDLIGLPPSPAEIDEFLADRSPRAYEDLVERLLASPHYGERWGRHWLDLVRFAGTSGHEFDYDILGAHRYRDYVIRAFNADLPYDRLVVEHIAGDLLESPRRHPTEGSNESILATGFFLFFEGTHSPVDLLEEESRRIDNQIDVLSKTFLGLTVACARCHDHKFDAISTKDYYALAGFLKSSRFQHAFIDPPDRVGAKVAELEAIKAKIESPSIEPHSQVAAYLAATASARSQGLDEMRLARWVAAIKDGRTRAPDHPLHAWTVLTDPAANASPEPWVSRRRAWLDRIKKREAQADPSVLFEDFESSSYQDWFVTGDAFGARPSRPGDWRMGPDGPIPVAPGQAHSGLVSDRLQGVLRSRTFPIEQKFIHYRASGRGGRINLVIDGFEKIKDPIYGGLTIAVGQGDLPKWFTQDVSMWAGHEAYIEIADGAAVRFEGLRSEYSSGDGSIAVDEIRFSDQADPPSRPGRLATELLDGPGVDSPDALARRFEQEIDKVLGQWNSGCLGQCASDAERIALLGWLLEHGLLRPAAVPAELLTQYRQVEAKIPAPTLAPALVDGTGEDERVHIRGGTKSLGDVVPRRFLEVFAGADTPSPVRGSGRLELARRMVDPANPLLARVMVNRIWKHHFGEGIVRSTDDFGVMGQPPSHPPLLDYLATRFIKDGWSIKRLHRQIVLSHAYRMRSVPDPASEQADPTNVLLHRMNVRRLEAEAIRDAILAVSGRLDRTLFGRSVPPHLTEFMEGRGKPAASGPLDGEGRRSLYIDVRRNFLSPMFMAFDFPAPASTMGRRNVSNVPAQALTLLNDPFVVEQARQWADRLLAGPEKSAESLLQEAYVTAFGRPPTAAECTEALAFLDGQARAKGSHPDPRAWADLCHVLLNVKEFIFVY